MTDLRKQEGVYIFKMNKEKIVVNSFNYFLVITAIWTFYLCFRLLRGLFVEQYPVPSLFIKILPPYACEKMLNSDSIYG